MKWFSKLGYSALWAGILAFTLPIQVEQSAGAKIPQNGLKSDGVIDANSPNTTVITSPFPTFNSQQLDQQIQRFSDYVAKYGAPDILIVGSSRALQGVDPQTLKDTLAERGYPNLKVFNFGINGATAQVVDWVLRRLLTTDHMPRLIIWADGSRAFNNGRIDHTFQRIAASPGYRLLNARQRSPFPKSPTLELGSLCIDAVPELLPALKSTFKSSSLTVSQTAQRESECRKPLKISLQQKPLFQSISKSQTPEELGFQVVTSQFVPRTYFQRYPKVAGVFDADYRNFSLEGSQTQALENVITFADRRNIPLIVVNLPLTPYYLDATRATYEDQFRSRMRRLARSRPFIFQDLAAQPRLSRNQYFADPSHINQNGAIAVAAQIGRELTVPILTIFVKPRTNPDQSFSEGRSRWVAGWTGFVYIKSLFDRSAG
jgi:hypothetical protein